jgi:hypothetical protein
MFILPITSWQSYAPGSWRQGSQLAGVSGKPDTPVLSGDLRKEMAETSNNQQQQQQSTASQQQPEHPLPGRAAHAYQLPYQPVGSVIDVSA